MDLERQTQESLRRQLTAFAQFMSRSLGEADLDSLMTEACHRARAGLGVSHAKLLEYMPGSDRMLLRAGVGWNRVMSASIKLRPTLDTPIGQAYAFF